MVKRPTKNTEDKPNQGRVGDERAPEVREATLISSIYARRYAQALEQPAGTTEPAAPEPRRR